MSGPVRLLVFGFGYSASGLAQRIKPETEWIAGTVRSPEKAAALAGQGFQPFVFDGSTPSKDAAAALADATHVIVSIPPGEGADPVLAHHRADIAGAREPALDRLPFDHRRLRQLWRRLGQRANDAAPGARPHHRAARDGARLGRPRWGVWAAALHLPDRRHLWAGTECARQPGGWHRPAGHQAGPPVQSYPCRRHR